MKRTTITMKRWVAAALAVIMLFTTADFAFAGNVAPGSQSTMSDGDIVAENYDGLTDEEKAVLSSDLLVGNTHTFTAPAASNGLITVDADLLTISADDYKSGSYVWKPVAARVVYDGGSEPVTLTNGEGNFTYAGNAYKVEVDYELYIDVAVDMQQALLKAPGQLVALINYAEMLLDGVSNLYVVESNIDTLYGYKDGIVVAGNTQQFAPEVRTAIINLYDEIHANEGSMDLTLLLMDYETAKASGLGLKYLLDNGNDIINIVSKTYTSFSALSALSGNAFLPTGVRKMVSSIVAYAADLETVKNGDWSGLNGVVKDGLTNDQYMTLDDLGYAAVGKTTALTAGAEAALLAAETTVEANVSQYNVTVNVEFNYVDGNNADQMEVYATTTFTMPEDATKQEILDAITASGVEAEAEAKIVEPEGYVKTVASLADDFTLKADLEYTISYSPKTINVTYVYDENKVVPYPFGFKITLPVYGVDGMAYEYDFGHGLYMDEGETVRVVQDMIIDRKVAQSKSNLKVNALVASEDNYADVLGAEAAELLKSLALKSATVGARVPTEVENEKYGLVVVEPVVGTFDYTVTAKNYASGLNGQNWVPVSGEIYNDETLVDTFTFVGNSATITPGTFTHVLVKYKLDVTSGVENSVLVNALNLSHELVLEAQAQKALMNDLLYENNLYNNLKKLDKTTMNQVGTAVSAYMGQDAKDAYTALKNSAMDGEALKLLGYLDAYKNDGLAWFYKDTNYELLKEQIDMLAEKLPMIRGRNDGEKAQFDQALIDNAPDKAESYTKLFEDVIENITDIAATLPNCAPNANIERNNTQMVAFVTALEAAIGKTVACGAYADKLIHTVKLQGSAPGMSTIKVVVQVADENGTIIDTSENDKYSAINKVYTVKSDVALSADDVTKITAILTALRNELKVSDEAIYEQIAQNIEGVPVKDALPAVGEVIAANKTYTFVYAPKSFEVVIEGTGVELEFTATTPEIELPANTQGNYQYVYTIEYFNAANQKKTVTYTVASTAKEIRFDEEMLASALAGRMTIKRESVDVYRRDVLALIDSLNSSLAPQGMTFIPVESADGKIKEVVLRLDSSVTGFSTAALKSVGTELSKTSLGYIGIGDGTLWDGANVKVSVQAVVDAILNSGIGSESLLAAIDENGNIVEFSLASGLEVILSAYIANPDLLGGKIGESTISFAYSATDSIDKLPLHITYEDFDTQTDELVKTRKALASGYVSFVLDNGMVDVVGTIPEKVYKLYLSELLITGQVDISDVNSVDLAESLEYNMDLIKPLITNDKVTVKSFENTLDKLAIDYDIAGYAETYKTIRKLVNNLINNAELTGDSVGSTYTGNISYDMTAALSKANLSEELQNMIAERDPAAGTAILNVPFMVKVTNIDNKYEAMVINPNASGLDLINYTTNVTNAIEKADKNTVIILLNDVVLKKDVVINNQMILDLNGKSLTGNMTANAGVKVVDSTLSTDTVGGINGTLSGNFAITGGRYTAPIDEFLPEGYVLENGVVSNKLYTITVVEDAEGVKDVTVNLSADFLDTANAPEVIALALDVAFDVALNFYTSASLTIGANGVYAVEANDLVDLLSKDNTSLVNEALGWLNYDGIEALANELIAAFTDFEALKNAVENGTDVVNYDVVTKAWKLEPIYVDNGDYVSANITSENEEIEHNMKVVVVGTEEEKKALADLCEKLNEIVVKKDLSVEFNGIIFNGGKPTTLAGLQESFTVDASGYADIEIDMTKDDNYAIILGVVLANDVTGTLRTELIAGIEELLTYGATNSLKEAVNKVTVAQLCAALKAAANTDFATLASDLGIDAGVAAAELEAVFEDVLDLAGMILAKLDITGPGATFGSREVNGQYGVYRVDKENWNKMKLAALTVNLFRETDPVIDPEIVDVTVSTNAAIAGFYVDGNMIYVDGHYDGITVDQLLASLNFVIRDHDAYGYTSYTGTAVGLGGELLVATGFKLTVKATNNTGGEDEETYVVIVMGDTNCDGLNDSGDAVKIRKYFMNHAAMIPGNSELSGYALKAAKINDDTDIDSGDAVKIRSKWLITWDNGAYVSTFAEQFD